MHPVKTAESEPEQFQPYNSRKTVMRVTNYPINQLTRRDRDLIFAPTPTNARTLYTLVPLILSVLSS